MAVFCGQCGQPAHGGGAQCASCGAPLPPREQHPGAWPPPPWPGSAAGPAGAGPNWSGPSSPGPDWSTPSSPEPGAAYPGWSGPGAAYPGQPARRATPTGLIAGLVALALAVLGSVYFLIVRPSQLAQSSAPVTVVVTATRGVSAGSAVAAPTTADPGGGAPSGTVPPAGPGTSSPPATSAAPTYPALTLAGQLCATTGTGPWASAAAGTAQTSCPFAVVVQAAYLATLGAATSAPSTPVAVIAHSPVTDKDYLMTCTGDQPVTCTGGTNAVVYLYGGTATFLR